MKRYLAFYMMVYYPQGGMNDLVGSFDSLDEAIESVYSKALTDFDYRWNDEWRLARGHVFDTEKNEKVWTKN